MEPSAYALAAALCVVLILVACWWWRDGHHLDTMASPVPPTAAQTAAIALINKLQLGATFVAISPPFVYRARESGAISQPQRNPTFAYRARQPGCPIPPWAVYYQWQHLNANGAPGAETLAGYVAQFVGKYDVGSGCVVGSWSPTLQSLTQGVSAADRDFGNAAVIPLLAGPETKRQAAVPADMRQVLPGPPNPYMVAKLGPLGAQAVALAGLTEFLASNGSGMAPNGQGAVPDWALYWNWRMMAAAGGVSAPPLLGFAQWLRRNRTTGNVWPGSVVIPTPQVLAIAAKVPPAQMAEAVAAYESQLPVAKALYAAPAIQRAQ